MCKLRVWWLYYIGTSHTLWSPYYENFCTTKVTILWLYIVQNVQVTSMVTVLYRHKSHIVITILWKFLYYQGHHTVTLHSTKCASYSMVTVLYRHKSHIAIPYYENFCTCKVTILWLYIVQNELVWWLYYIGTSHTLRSPYYEKFLYYQGHHTVTLHSTKCASYEYGDCTI